MITMFRLKGIILLVSIMVLVFLSCDKEDNNEEGPQNNPPNAEFSVTPAAGNTGTIFSFDASASSDTEDDPGDLQFRWDWNNDGSWDTQFTNNATATHSYGSEGDFTVKLEVRDSGGLSGTDTRQVTVTNTGNLPPNAPADPSPVNNAVDIPVQAGLQWSCSDPNGDALTYDVYFGTDQNPPLVITDHPQNTWAPAGDLELNTQYYWKIVAEDQSGATTDGPVWTFTTEEQSSSFECGEIFTDPRDNKQYPTKEFDGKCWMVKNMNIGTMISGTSGQGDNGIIEKYCYGDNEANCDQYGGLYQWNELMQYVTNEKAQGICPDGWHVPSDGEWMELEMAVGMPQSEVIKTGLRGTDEGVKMQVGGGTGFDALLGGYRNNGGAFFNIDQYGTFFTSTETSINLSWCRYLFNDKDQVLRDKYEKAFGYSVRCIKD